MGSVAADDGRTAARLQCDATQRALGRDATAVMTALFFSFLLFSLCSWLLVDEVGSQSQVEQIVHSETGTDVDDTKSS